MSIPQPPYRQNQDDDVLKTFTTEVGELTVDIQAATRAGYPDGTKRNANDDAFALYQTRNCLYAAVFDGVTSQKPIPELNGLSPARFASHFLSAYFPEVVELNEDTEEIMLDLNRRLLATVQAFSTTDLDDIFSLPASVATILKIDPVKQLLQISHVGDTFCILYRAKSSELVTNNLNAIFDAEIFKVQKNLATEQNITNREAKKFPEIKEAVLKKFRDHHNRPDGTGTGAINGQPQLKQYIQTIKKPLQDISAILLGSDGLPSPSLPIEDEENRLLIYSLLKQASLKDLIDLKVKTEDADPDWQTYVRGKHSDDATGIYLTITRQ